MTISQAQQRPMAGYSGLVIGGIALILVLVHFWAGPFAPQQDVGVSIGEIAADIKEAAKRSITGKPQPAPEAKPWDIDRVLEVSAAVVAGVAILLGLLGLIRRETWRPAAAAVTLGVGAIVFQTFVWAVLIVCGIVIILAVLHYIGDIFSI